MKYRFIGLVSLGLLAVSAETLAVCEIGRPYDAACQQYLADNAERLKEEAEAEAKAKEEEAAKEEARKNIFAFDDEFTIVNDPVENVIVTVTGNVMTNDGSAVLGTRMFSPLASEYGRLDFDFSTGEFTYTLASDSAAYLALQENEEVLDVFNYQVYGEYGFTDEANLIIHVLGSKTTEEVAKEAARKNIFAFDDEFTIFKSSNPDELITEITGNVTANDGSGVLGTRMLSPLVSQYGRLDFNFGTGEFTYTLATDSAGYLALQENDEALDVFNYQVYGEYDFTDEANLIIHILGGKKKNILTTNIEVEDNDRSAKATPLNSGLIIKGQLTHGDDQDWYSLASLGDEIIHLELCSDEESCGDEIKDSLVLYIFDADKLTTAMENNTVRLDWYRNDTGAAISSYQYNHLYLNGSLGVFDEALVGVIDPCLGNKRELDIGVSPGPRQYYVAISSALTNTDDSCGEGNNILEKEGASFTETTVNPETGEIVETVVTTTQEYTKPFLFSRDQYDLRLTRTGINPLRFTDSEIAEFNTETRILRVANVRVIDDLYEVDLQLMSSDKEIKIGQRFTVLSSNHLNEALNGNPYQATYNRSNHVIKLPKVVYNFTDSKDIYSLATEIYSLELLYLPDEGQIEVTGINKLNPF